MIDSFPLKKEISGNRLVEILRTACSELGFNLSNMAEKLAKYGRTPNNEAETTYKAEKSYQEEDTLKFDAAQTFAIKFLGINGESQYSSVNCQPQLGTMSLIDVNIDDHPNFKPDYDAFIAKVVELSGQ